MSERKCSMCQNPAVVYVMGPYANDWADYYCVEHEAQGVKALGPGALIERVKS